MEVNVCKKEIERIVVEEKEVVTIEMSREDAVLLEIITWGIGGKPEGSRGRINLLREALHNADIYSTDQQRRIMIDPRNSLYLND